MLPGWAFGDYLVPRGTREALFAYSSAVMLPGLEHTLRVDYVSSTAELEIPSRHSTSMCPAEGDWTPWFELGSITAKFGRLATQQAGHPGAMPALDFYNTFVVPDCSAESVQLNFAQGARFAVGRERIRSRPREYYQKLLSTLSHNEDPIAGYWMEYMWADVFRGDEATQCAMGPRCSTMPTARGVNEANLTWRQMANVMAGRFPAFAGRRGLEGVSGASGAPHAPAYPTRRRFHSFDHFRETELE